MKLRSEIQTEMGKEGVQVWPVQGGLGSIPSQGTRSHMRQPRSCMWQLRPSRAKIKKKKNICIKKETSKEMKHKFSDARSALATSPSVKLGTSPRHLMKLVRTREPGHTRPAHGGSPPTLASGSSSPRTILGRKPPSCLGVHDLPLRDPSACLICISPCQHPLQNHGFLSN